MTESLRLEEENQRLRAGAQAEREARRKEEQSLKANAEAEAKRQEEKRLRVENDAAVARRLLAEEEQKLAQERRDSQMARELQIRTFSCPMCFDDVSIRQKSHSSHSYRGSLHHRHTFIPALLPASHRRPL